MYEKYVVLPTVQRVSLYCSSDKMFIRRISVSCLVLLTDRGPHCKGRRTAFGSPLMCALTVPLHLAFSERTLMFRKSVQEHIVRSYPICLCGCNVEMLRNYSPIADLNAIKSISHAS
jgi:hypothetical protein